MNGTDDAFFACRQMVWSVIEDLESYADAYGPKDIYDNFDPAKALKTAVTYLQHVSDILDNFIPADYEG